MPIKYVKLSFTVKEETSDQESSTKKKDFKITNEDLKYQSVRQALISKILKLDEWAADELEEKYGEKNGSLLEHFEEEF